jgi:alcohol dehydrogenase (cytochrome c)
MPAPSGKNPGTLLDRRAGLRLADGTPRLDEDDRRGDMSRHYPWIAIAAFVGVLAIPVTVAVQSDGARRGQTGKDWPAVGGDWGNMRYSTLDQISAQNVTKLGGAWMSQKFDAPTSSRAMPVVKDGLMFVTAPPAVYALDPKTGATVWRYQAGGGRGQGAAQAGFGSPAREGVAIGEGLVFVGLSAASIIALNEKTGELVWNKYLGDNPRDKGQTVSGAPLYAGGLVSVGLSADNGWRGQVVALDPKTGKEAWRFFTIPGPGEPGHETWPRGSDIWKRGGGAVWLAGTVDPDLGTVYYVTGNGVPQLGGEGRAGDNLYLCSVVALDARTGKLKWHYQVIRHDVWEADIAISPVLYDTQVDGRPRKGIAAMRADGYLFMLDRETGKPLMKVEDRPVPQDSRQKSAATQPFPAGADRVLPDCGDWKKKSTPKGFDIGCFFTPASVEKQNVLAPNYGMRVAPMAYSPQTGYFYAAGAAGLAWLRRGEDPYFFNNFNTRVPGINDLSYGVLAAIDSRTNKIAWKKEYPAGRPSGATVTAGGLMFQASSDRNIEAYDARTGNVLWQFRTGAAGGPVAVYDVDGEEFIATVAGANVWAFKLGGTLPQGAPFSRSPQEAFTGPIKDTAQIETASLQRDRGFTGTRYFTDEHAFEPYRARVKVGTQVTWRNNGALIHTIVAQDGSWSTGPLNDAEVGARTFDKPGSYTYTCKEHPWAYGQIIVVE